MQKHQRQSNEHWHNEGGYGGYFPQRQLIANGLGCTQKNTFNIHTLVIQRIQSQFSECIYCNIYFGAASMLHVN